MISYEFGILVALEFNLTIKYEHEFISHYERIVNRLQDLNINQNYNYTYNPNNIKLIENHT
jgi:hypothetical protein